MRKPCSPWFCLALGGIFAVGLPPARGDAPDDRATFRTGFAERDITPEIGMEQPGGYGKSYHTSLHDPCKVRAAVFDDGALRVAVVGIDGGCIYRPVVQAARRGIWAKTGIPPGAVLIGASHSHSAGPLGLVQPHQYDHASPQIQRLAYQQSACADPRYLARVEAQLIAAVAEADARRGPAVGGLGRGSAPGVAFNRRLRMRNGRTFTHPGQLNPQIVGYAGPTDPDVLVLGVWDAAGKARGCLVSFACHATTSPGGISASYIYYLEQTIRGAMGKDCVVVFLQGFSGDITQVDNLNPYVNPAPEDWARLVGARIGAEAVKAWLRAARGPLVPLAARSRVLDIDRRVPSPERLRRSRELVQKTPLDAAGYTDWAFAKEIVLLDALLAARRAEEVEVQAIQIGPAVLLANPAEMFCQYGLDLKARSRFPFTFPVGYANGFNGYVPTAEAFGPQGGGYETRLTSCSNLEVAAGRRILEASLELAAGLTPGPVPSRAKVQPRRPDLTPVPPELE
jgi:hypothetical protein